MLGVDSSGYARVPLGGIGYVVVLFVFSNPDSCHNRHVTDWRWHVKNDVLHSGTPPHNEPRVFTLTDPSRGPFPVVEPEHVLSFVGSIEEFRNPSLRNVHQAIPAQVGCPLLVNTRRNLLSPAFVAANIIQKNHVRWRAIHKRKSLR